jgi:flagellar protein FlbD
MWRTPVARIAHTQRLGADEREDSGSWMGREGLTRDGETVIILTRLNGQRFAVNPDLIERVESTPDTIVTLVDGTKYLVTEDIEAIADLVIEHRAAIVARAIDVARTEENPALASVTGLRHQPRLTVAPEAD